MSQENRIGVHLPDNQSRSTTALICSGFLSVTLATVLTGFVYRFYPASIVFGIGFMGMACLEVLITERPAWFKKITAAFSNIIGVRKDPPSILDVERGIAAPKLEDNGFNARTSTSRAITFVCSTLLTTGVVVGSVAINHYFSFVPLVVRYIAILYGMIVVSFFYDCFQRYYTEPDNYKNIESQALPHPQPYFTKLKSFFSDLGARCRSIIPDIPTDQKLQEAAHRRRMENMRPFTKEKRDSQIFCAVVMAADALLAFAVVAYCNAVYRKQ